MAVGCSLVLPEIEEELIAMAMVLPVNNVALGPGLDEPTYFRPTCLSVTSLSAWTFRASPP